MKNTRFNTLIRQMAFCCLLAIPALCLSNTPKRYGEGLTERGSGKTISTVFTNPGENSSTMMNISFSTPPHVHAGVEVEGGGKKMYFKSVGELCDTYDSIPSKLSNNHDVIERHYFDKHDVTLKGLKPDTDYKYRVVADSAGHKVYSEERYFRTAGRSWKAGIIGDFHHYSPSWSRLEAAMRMVDVLDSVSGGLDWMLSTGDQCSWGGSYNQWTELSEQPGFKDFMWAVVQGNHDHSTRDNEKSDSFFRDSHAFPFNGYPGQIGVSYWFEYGDVLFFMLNSEAMHSAESLEPVFQWMENVVAHHPSDYIVVVQHYQWLIGTDGANSQLDRFRHFFDKIGVDLAISGNNHAYLRTDPLYEREPVQPEYGTYYVVTPSSDNARGRALKPLKANKNIVAKRWSEGPHTVGGMVMDVNPERIVMTLYDRNGKVEDTFTVPCKK